MPASVAALESRTAGLTDPELIVRILAGERELFELVMRRHNQQLYRAARAIVRDEAEVEDIMQQAYLNAFAHLEQFQGRSLLSTWLTRIVVNEACARRRRLARLPVIDPPRHEADDMPPDAVASEQPTPEHQAYAGELHRVLEEAVDTLPETYRLVFMLREVEGMSTGETASALELGDEAVKTRLHRARAMLRQAVASRIGASAPDAFPFHAPRCDRVVAGVLSRIANMPPS